MMHQLVFWCMHLLAVISRVRAVRRGGVGLRLRVNGKLGWVVVEVVEVRIFWRPKHPQCMRATFWLKARLKIADGRMLCEW